VLQRKREYLHPFVVKNLLQCAPCDSVNGKVKSEGDVKISQMPGYQLLCRSRGIQVQRYFPPHQVIGGKQGINPEEVITVKMADKNMVDPAETDPVASHLHLSALATVN